jgi:asparagine synthase (glutamine-hydrolysing)
VPFLDHPLIELMAQIPSEYKVRGREKKILLKQAFRGLLPDSILYRKKMGFSVPLALWLRTDLKPLMQDTLSEKRVKSLGYLQWDQVSKLMVEHLSGAANHENKLWSLMNLALWEQQRYHG